MLYGFSIKCHMLDTKFVYYVSSILKNVQFYLF